MIEELEIADMLLNIELQSGYLKSINIQTCESCGDDFNSCCKGMYCPICLREELKERTEKTLVSELVMLLDKRRSITHRIETVKNILLDRFQKDD